MRRLPILLGIVLEIAATAAALPATAAIRLTDITSAAGVTLVHDPDGAQVGSGPLQDWWGPGVGWIDHNKDGWPDLYVCNGQTGNVLFLNNADGTFSVASAALGVAGQRVSNGLAVADIDNNGSMDFAVGNFLTQPFVYLRGPESYTNVAPLWDVEPVFDNGTVPEGMGVAFGDIDRDGFVDLYLANHRGQIDVVYMNLGGIFQKVDAVIPAAWGFQPVFLDFDDDGDQDIYVANDFGENFLFENLGAPNYELINNAGTYKVDGTDFYSMSMGVAVGDYDNDLDLDIYVTNYFGNALYDNQMSTLGRFVQRADGVNGAGLRFDQNCWGIAWADLDLDGHLDLIQASGYIYSDNETLLQPIDLPNKVWRNDGDKTFTDVSDDAGFNDRGMGRGLATADFDRDGDLDVVVTNNTMDHPDTQQRYLGELLLYRNVQDAGHHWVGLRLEGGGEHANGRGCNRAAIGARVYVVAGGTTQMRELQSGSSYLSQNHLEANFGLGATDSVDEVRVRWVCGAEQVFTNVTPGGYWRLIEGADAAVPVAVALSGFDVRPVSSGIELEWWTSATGQILTTRIERAPADLLDLMAPIDLRVDYQGDRGRAFDDRVEPGVRYAYRIEIEGQGGTRVTSGIVYARAGTTASALLHPRVGQNYPNPFNPSTTILVELPRSTDLRLVLYDERGRLVRELLAGRLGPGTHPIDWDGLDDAGRAVASGTYRYVLITPERSSSRALSLVR